MHDVAICVCCVRFDIMITIRNLAANCCHFGSRSARGLPPFKSAPPHPFDFQGVLDVRLRNSQTCVPQSRWTLHREWVSPTFVGQLVGCTTACLFKRGLCLLKHIGYVLCSQLRPGGAPPLGRPPAELLAQPAQHLCARETWLAVWGWGGDADA